MEERKELGGIPASSGNTTSTAKPVAAAPTANKPAGPAAPAPQVAPTIARKPGQPTPALPVNKPAGTPQSTQNIVRDPKTLLRQKVLNNIVQRRIGETKQSIYKQLGVENEQQLQDLLGKVKGYEDLNSKFYNINTELTTLKAEKVALASGVRTEKIDDVLTYLKGKGLEYTAENIKQAVQTHPEWITNQAEAVVKPATIGKVGQQQQPVTSDIEKARNLFPSLRTTKK
jgi:hypothetical protein